MTDIVAAWTDQGWCDACKTNIEAHPHEPGCPIAEIERLKADLAFAQKLMCDVAKETRDVGLVEGDTNAALQAYCRALDGK